MIPLGLRLAISGREAITRMIVLAVAVGLGVGLLLTAVAATNAVTAWNSRHAWFWTGTSSVPAGPATGVTPLWWHPSGDIFDSQQVSRFDVAASCAGVRPMMMTSERGDGRAASPIVPTRRPG